MDRPIAAHLVAEVPPWLRDVEELCEEDACHCQHSPPTEQAGVNCSSPVAFGWWQVLTLFCKFSHAGKQWARKSAARLQMIMSNDFSQSRLMEL